MKTQSREGYLFDKHLEEVARRVVNNTSFPEDMITILKHQQTIQSKVNAIRDWDAFIGITNEITRKEGKQT